MAVLPRSTFKLLTRERPQPFTGSVELEWSYRDTRRKEQTLRITLDLGTRSLRIDHDDQSQTRTLASDAISSDASSATTSIDIPGVLSATLDSTSGRCLFAQSPKLAEIGADRGRSRAMISRV